MKSGRRREMNHPSDDRVAKSQPLQALVDVRNRILAIVQEIRDKQNEIDFLSESTINVSYMWSKIDYRHNHGKTAQHIVDKEFWEFMADSSQLSNAMTGKAKEVLYNKISENPDPFTLDMVQGYSENLQRIYGDNAMQTIKEVFNSFINSKYHGSNWSDQKVDNLKKIEADFRCCYGVRYDSYFHRFRADGYYGGKGCRFDDLLTACYLLDVGIRPNTAQTFTALAEEQFKQGNQVDTPYFTVIAFKNNNQRVKWNKDKIKVLQDLNKYGSSGETLPDSMRKRYKPKHFEKEM
jgi:hypothetical protein